MQPKTAGRLTGIVALAAAFVAVNSGAPLAVTSAGAKPAVNDLQTQAALLSAESEAQRHLDRFFDLSLSGGSVRANPMVRVNIDGARFWLEPRSRTPRSFFGAAIEDIGEQGAGDLVEFSADQVKDWLFTDDNQRMYGNFRVRARLTQLSPQNAANIAAVLSISPTPEGW